MVVAGDADGTVSLTVFGQFSLGGVAVATGDPGAKGTVLNLALSPDLRLLSVATLSPTGS